ncbi:MAG: hypothetical protein JSR46_11130 [Verrucomicrobia bacterium]|nr:hypothetical protein [Verrucomicrobiota bacterium]
MTTLQKYESDNVRLESEIVGDEPSEREGNCCGRMWKCLTYECTPSPNTLIVVFGGAVAILLELGIYLACPHCPPLNCSTPLTSAAAISPIGFGGALMFAGLAKGICILSDTITGKRKDGTREAKPLVLQQVALDEGTNCCRRTWKCITYEVTPSPNVLVAVAGGVLGAALGLSAYLVYPTCRPTECSVPEQSYGLTSLIGFGGALLAAVLTKVACVFSDTVAKTRHFRCQPSYVNV